MRDKAVGSVNIFSYFLGVMIIAIWIMLFIMPFYL